MIVNTHLLRTLTIAIFGIWCARLGAQPKAAAPFPLVKTTSRASVVLQPFRDPWPAGRERFRDISDHAQNEFDAFLNGSQEFNYENDYTNSAQKTQVTLTYD